jgi:hypothetical protein
MVGHCRQALAILVLHLAPTRARQHPCPSGHIQFIRYIIPAISNSLDILKGLRHVSLLHCEDILGVPATETGTVET